MLVEHKYRKYYLSKLEVEYIDSSDFTEYIL